MTGRIGAGEPQAAKALWSKYEAELRDRNRPLLRLLRCHAERGKSNDFNAPGCAAAFAAYAD